MSVTDADAKIERAGAGARRPPRSRRRCAASSSDYFESRIATAALAVLVLIVCLALLAPLIAPQNPYDLAEVDVLDSRLPPGTARHGRLHLLARHRRRRPRPRSAPSSMACASRCWSA